MPDNAWPDRSSDEKQLIAVSPADLTQQPSGVPTNPLGVYLQRIADQSERQREKFAPEIIDFSPSQSYYSSAALASSFVTHIKYRIIAICMSGAAGDRMDLTLGTRRFSFYNVTGAPIVLDFPYEIDRGIDITVKDFTTPASVAWSFMMYGYPE